MFVVVDKKACMPMSCWGANRYRKIAVVETDGTCYPAMISERARGVLRVVQVWDRVHDGKTDRSAAARARREAAALAAELAR